MFESFLLNYFKTKPNSLHKIRFVLRLPKRKIARETLWLFFLLIGHLIDFAKI